MVVDRMNFNDHGPVHARISSGSALEIFQLLTDKIEPTSISQGITDIQGAKIIVLCGSYLHDLGNSIHRSEHYRHSCYLASPILDRLLFEVYPDDPEYAYKIKCEILHAIYTHEDEVQCLTIEAGAAKVADGTDMAQGRARIPYRKGKRDIHGISAMAIQRVDLERGEENAVRINVEMSNPAGVFQIEEVLGKKIETSGIQDHIEIVATESNKKTQTIIP
jgi:metal-dependent HD superfamily phosphatase/phosphodiesterase